MRKLGNDEFGIWVVVGAFVSFTGLLDFGFGTSFVKYIAEYSARDDREGVNGVLTTGLTVYFIFTVVIITVVFLTMSVMLHFFTFPQSMEEKVLFVLELGIITWLIGNFMGVYLSVINGLQRMDISRSISVFISICFAIGCIIALQWGFGIRGLAVMQLIAHTIGTVVTVYFAYRLYPSLRFDLKSVKKHFIPLFRYGLNLQVSNFALLISFHFDKLLINRFFGTSHVTFYDIGNRPPATVRSLPMLLLSTLTPAAAELEVRKGRAELYELFSRASKYVSIFAFPLFIGAMVTSQAIIEAWVGHGYNMSVVVMRILCIGYLLNIAAGPVSPLVQGMGQPHYQRNAEVLSLLLNVVLSLLLINLYGFYGAPIGTALAMSATFVYYLWSFHRFMERPLLPFLRVTLLKPALCAVASGVVALAVTSALMPYGSSGRLAVLPIFLGAGCIFAISYVVMILKWRYLDDQDIALLWSLVTQRLVNKWVI